MTLVGRERIAGAAIRGSFVAIGEKVGKANFFWRCPGGFGALTGVGGCQVMFQLPRFSIIEPQSREIQK
jgi:hypothetical protein